ncbi:MAG: hypothetical protein MJA29_07775 [Candidatus Omnitrophica bacterium]|nr:hypothetical protein [Candidatus Omnitrophota bacterium]
MTLKVAIITAVLTLTITSLSLAQFTWGSPDEESTEEERSARIAAQKRSLEEAAKAVDPGLRKAAIEEKLHAGSRNEAREELMDTLVSREYPGISSWAARQLIKLAEADGTLSQVIAELKSRDPGDHPHLKRAIAEGYVKLKQWPEVVGVYEEIIADNPADAAARSRLTDYYLLAGRPDKIIPDLEARITANPGDKAAGDLLLRAYVQAKQKDKALALYKKRIKAAPSSPGLRGRYAQALEDLGMLSQSLREWEKAAELDPANAFFQRKAEDVAGRLNR